MAVAELCCPPPGRSRRLQFMVSSAGKGPRVFLYFTIEMSIGSTVTTNWWDEACEAQGNKALAYCPTKRHLHPAHRVRGGEPTSVR